MLRRAMGMVAAGVVLAGSAFAVEPAGEALPKVRFELVGKVEDRPLLVTNDGHGRAFVVEQSGRVRIIAGGKILEKPFLDLTEKVYPAGECGLLSLAFHPKFAENGLFYVDYVCERPGTRKKVKKGTKEIEVFDVKTVIAEFHVDPGASVVDIKTERSVIEIDQPYENHKGGMIAFGPGDGMLYIGMGDGGNQRDPHKNGQNLGVPLAKMLRIDVSPREGYAIPKDNPFVGIAGARPEIWSYGMRNPWRFSFDRQTELLYAADVGEDRWEEIDIITRGGNFGWSVREGGYPFNRAPRDPREPKPDPVGETPAGFVGPIKAYWHDIGQSITGGYVYRGKAIPALNGWYLYGDYAKGTFWGLKYDGNRVVGDEVLKIENEKEIRPLLPSGFGEDADGEIYVCSHQDGKVWKIVAAGK